VELALVHAHSRGWWMRETDTSSRLRRGNQSDATHGANRHENSPKGLAIEGVKHRVAGTVSNGSATVSLSSLAKLERLASEGTLVLLCFAKEGE